MEVKILEESKNRILVEIIGESHAFCNALKKELYWDKHVKVAAYNIEHPYVANPKIVVETDGQEKPKNALLKAAERIKDNADKIKKMAEKELK